MDKTAINGDALRRALILMVGTTGDEVVEKTYEAFNAAQEAAFTQGVLKGIDAARDAAIEQANRNVEERLDAAFDNGYMHGHADAEEDADATISLIKDTATYDYNTAYDDGYVSGVDDARRRPTAADENIQAIINASAAEAFEAMRADDEMLDSLDEFDPLDGGVFTR